MSWADRLTPQDTEEIRPGLFVQKKLGKYRVVHPAAWDGKINWSVTLLGSQPIKHLFIFALIIFLAYSYTSATSGCEEFQADPCPYLANLTSYCSERLLNENPLGGIRGDDGKEYTYNLQDLVE